MFSQTLKLFILSYSFQILELTYNKQVTNQEVKFSAIKG